VLFVGFLKPITQINARNIESIAKIKFILTDQSEKTTETAHLMQNTISPPIRFTNIKRT
jgi:hypothetical protein